MRADAILLCLPLINSSRIQMEQRLMHIFIFFEFLDTTQYNIFQDKHGYIFHLELLQCVLK